MPREQPIFRVTSWVYSSDGKQLRITHHTRKKVVVATDNGPVELRRARLERDGTDHVDGELYTTLKHWIPAEVQEIAS